MGSGSETQTNTVPTYQEKYAKGVMNAAKKIGSGEFTPYTGQMSPNIDPNFAKATKLYAGLNKAYTGNLDVEIDPNFAKATDLYGGIASAANRTPQDWQNLYSQNMSGYTSAVMDPALAEMQRQRQQQLVGENARIIGSGAFDSSRRGVFEGESSAGYGISQDKMIADLMRQGYSEAVANTMSQFGAQQDAANAAAAGYMSTGGANMAAQRANIDANYGEFQRQKNAATTAASGFMGVGAANMAAKQAQQTAAYNEFLRQQNDPYQRLQALIGGYGAMPNQGSTTTTKQNGLLDWATVFAGM